jgi:hypothetical protein
LCLFDFHSQVVETSRQRLSGYLGERMASAEALQEAEMPVSWVEAFRGSDCSCFVHAATCRIWWGRRNLEKLWRDDRRAVGPMVYAELQKPIPASVCPFVRRQRSLLSRASRTRRRLPSRKESRIWTRASLVAAKLACLT